MASGPDTIQYLMPGGRRVFPSFRSANAQYSFVATANGDSPTTLNLHGTGEDGISVFALDGYISPRTGQIMLQKVYSGGHPAWGWTCIMTPMGIVGSWGQSDYGGWIWQWKVGWTAGH